MLIYLSWHSQELGCEIDEGLGASYSRRAAVLFLPSEQLRQIRDAQRFPHGRRLSTLAVLQQLFDRQVLTETVQGEDGLDGAHTLSVLFDVRLAVGRAGVFLGGGELGERLAILELLARLWHV